MIPTPNHGYNRGADAERLLVSLKRSEGYAAWRTAGSHSPADVIAAKKGRVELYQIKAGRRRWPSRDERFALRIEAGRAGAEAFITFKEARKGFEHVPMDEWPADNR